MSDLSKVAISALVVSPIFMVLSAIQPQIAWVLGALLSLLGVVTLFQAFRNHHDLWGYFVGLITLIFGIATEFASVDGLVILAFVGIVADPLIGLVERYL